MADWGALKPNVPGNTLPIWEEDGKQLGQSISILQALARKHGYAPKGFLGEWANAWVSDTLADFQAKGYTGKLFGPSVDEATVKAWAEDNMKLNVAIERHLTITDTKFLAGDTLTASDFHFFSHVTAFAFNKNMNHKNVQVALAATHGTYKTPKLNAWVERMQGELKDHLAKRPAYIL